MRVRYGYAVCPLVPGDLTKAHRFPLTVLVACLPPKKPERNFQSGTLLAHLRPAYRTLPSPTSPLVRSNLSHNFLGGTLPAHLPCANRYLLPPSFLLTLSNRNLSHNFLGGTLPAHLPTVFPALEHLSLDHCRKGSSDTPTDFNWQQYAGQGLSYEYCDDGHVSYGGTTYVLSGTIPEAWGAWSTTLKTL